MPRLSYPGSPTPRTLDAHRAVAGRPAARHAGGRAGYAADVDTLVIDIDGTLLDSNYHHAVAWSRAFQAHDVAVPVWRIHRALGMGGDRLVAAVAGDEAEERVGDAVRERWEEEYDSMIERTRLFAGARELLDAGRERGMKVALASSAIPRHAQHALDLLDAGSRSDGWTTAGDAEESKPDPELLEEALARVEGEAALMVGDAVWDVEAARRRGIPAVCLRCGGVSEAELREAGAVAVYDDPADLAAHLDEAIALAQRASRP